MSEIDIELYKIFYEVAKVKSITKAAEAMFISQPAVTMSIRKLEEQLETTLFVRTKRGVLFTNEGQVLFEYVSLAMENIRIGENKIENLKRLETGTVRIGIGTNLTRYFLMEYLKEYHKKFPKISINIDTSITSEVINSLESGKVDVGIIAKNEKDVDTKKFSIEYIEDMEYIFVVSADYAKNINSMHYEKNTINVEYTKNDEDDEGKLKLKDLNDYQLLLQNVNSNSRQFLDSFASKYKVKFNSMLELASYSLIIEFAKIGMGIGFIPKRYVENELKNGELLEVKVKEKIPKTNIVVLLKKGYLPSFSTEKLIEEIRGDNK